ncbi:ANTAR domain-containing protein [Streptomyces sp. N35]|uniref:ANTAR domain-containing protein n=1 Tax=Streptomyces sp. N35 TaxID=2795730 RepID=UPI001F3A7E33|nr:GAF and ANTAR domain-containing protein [Streptomyces sp. N35]
MTESGRDLRLAGVLVAAADTLGEPFSLPTYLSRFADDCVEVLGADAAGILLVGADAGISIVTSKDPHGRVRGLLEIQHQGGPCLDACASGEPVPPVRLAGREAAEQWPQLTARALHAGMTVTCAVPLRRGDTLIGALNLFSNGRPEHQHIHLELAQLLADAVAIGLMHRRMHEDCTSLTRQLQSALSSRVRIEQAKGLLAERWGVKVDAAFTSLRAYARRVRRPVDSIAQELLDGQLDDAALEEDRPRTC